MNSIRAARPVALITGANRGIGLEAARQLGRSGHIVLIGSRDLQRGEAACAQLRSEDIEAEVLHLDVTDPASIAAAASHVEDKHGRLDILINNAGILLEDISPDPANPEGLVNTLPSDVEMDVVRETLVTNTLAPIAVTKAFLPLLRRAQAASIVNVSSWLGSLAVADAACQGAEDRYINLLAYNVSKAALNAATLQFAMELRSTPIRVNAVDPGHCATDINGFSGDRSAAEAAEIVVRAADLGPNGATGRFLGPEPRSW